MLAGLHDFAVTTSGSTMVQFPAESLAGEPQNLLASSHSTTPLQLLMNMLPVIIRVCPYGPGTRLSAPDSEMYTAGSGNPLVLGPPTRALRTKVLSASRRL